jgi:outer membrane receptor protein involved in Fe transport
MVAVRSESKQYATFRNLLLTGSAASALSLGLAPAAFAQEATGPVEKVTVTGTRIPQKNLITTSPVTQVTAADVDTQGVTRLEDLANELPQVFAAQNSTVSNGASGSANINLRGLGSARTLVLINGRRMPYGNPNTSAGDVNGIPAQLVERVEVLTGGASAVYGSDALAGVVNFIMRRDFEGVQIDAQYGYYEHHNDFEGPGYLREVIAARGATNPFEFQLPEDDVNDGVSKQITGVMGVSNSDGTGNITAYIGYRSNDQILQRYRDYSACALGPQSAAAVPGVPAGAVHWTCGGSGTNATGNFTDFATYQFTIDRGTGLARNFVTATDQYNFGPLNYYQRPDQTYTLGAFMHYQIDEQIEAYLDLMFSDYSTISQIAPSGSFFSVGSINCGNPFLNGTADDGISGNNAFSVAQLSTIGCTPAAIAANTVVPMYIARRNVEGGGRQQDLGFDTYRMSGGFRGELTSGIDYDLALQYSKVRFAQTYLNDFSVSRLNRAFNVVDVGGVPTCQSVVDGTDLNCVPYNVFENGGVTQAALDYLQVPLMQRAELDQRIGTFTLNIDMGTWGMKSPWAESPFAAVLGAEFRRDALKSVTDENFATGNAAGQGGPTIGLTGETDVSEYFGELQIPLLEGQEFAHQVTIDLAYRYSEYDNGVTTDTWKIGGDWSPTEDVRFRASRQRAVRAANVIELFSAQGFNLFDMNDDPCQLSDPGGDGVAPAANCQGVNPWQVTLAQASGLGLTSPAGQYNFLQGGNPDLTPEQGDTTTLGIVFTPTFIENLIVSVDWFEIEIDNTISLTGAANTVNACYFGGDLGSCARILRNPGTGQLWIGAGRVEDLNTNIGSLKTTGVDVNASYRFDLSDLDLEGAGGLRLELIGTYLQELLVDPGAASGAEPFDCAGKHSGRCNTGTLGNPVNPEWRHRFRATWQTAWDTDIHVTWRHYGEVERDQGGTAELDYTLDAENYFDLAATIGLPLNSRLRLGMNNVFDDDPPLSDNVGTTGNGNTYPQIYEARGRFVFMGLTTDF